MLKILRRALPIALTAGLAASGAWAAVNNSHHDLSSTGWATQTEVCYFCHGVQSTADATEYGAVGSLCLIRCHAGLANNPTGGTLAIPNIPKYLLDTGAVTTLGASVTAVNVLDGNAHGLTKTDLWNKYGAANVTLGNSPAATANFPYVAGAGSLECTSCHNVHNKANTPFLQSPLFTGSTGATSFCQDCHYPSGTGTPDGRGNDWNAGEQNPNGDHPVNFGLRLGNVTSPNRVNTERKGRYIQIDASGVFDSTTNTVLQTSGQNYTTGGKISTWTTAAGGGTELFGCYTCHSPHMPQTAAGGGPNLLLRDTVNATTAGGAVGTWNPLCVSCHGTLANAASADAVEQNPGLSTSLYYHPTGPNANPIIGALASNKATYLNSNSTFRFAVDLTRIIAVGNQGTLNDNTSGIENVTYKPRCTSCHDVHGGINNSQALLDLDGTRDGAFTGTFCNACHQNDLPDVNDQQGQAGEVKADAALAGVHHRTSPSGTNLPTGATAAAVSYQTADGASDLLSVEGASWSLGAGTPGDMADGLGCVDCHTFNGGVHSTAHNW